MSVDIFIAVVVAYVGFAGFVVVVAVAIVS